MVEGLRSRRGGPIIKTSLVGLVESLRQEVRGRMGQGIRVDQNSSGQVNKCKRRHLGDCSDSPRCYNCGKAGHIARDCRNCQNCDKPGI